MTGCQGSIPPSSAICTRLMKTARSMTRSNGARRTRRSAKFRDHEDLATAIRKAIRMPAEEPKVRNLFLNQRVSPIASLISRPEWMACAGNAALEEGEED